MRVDVLRGTSLKHLYIPYELVIDFSDCIEVRLKPDSEVILN